MRLLLRHGRQLPIGDVTAGARRVGAGEPVLAPKSIMCCVRVCVFVVRVLRALRACTADWRQLAGRRGTSKSVALATYYQLLATCYWLLRTIYSPLLTSYLQLDSSCELLASSYTPRNTSYQQAATSYSEQHR